MHQTGAISFCRPKNRDIIASQSLPIRHCELGRCMRFCGISLRTRGSTVRTSCDRSDGIPGSIGLGWFRPGKIEG